MIIILFSAMQPSDSAAVLKLMGYIVVLGLASADAAHQDGPLVAEAGKALSRQLGARVDPGSSDSEKP